MFDAFKLHIKEEAPALADQALLIACSGGVDSMVLVHLCERLGLQFEIAHCNFQLREEESEGDEQLVAGLADSLGRRYHSTRFDTRAYAEKNGISIQMAARELRYRWFSEIMEEDQIDLLLTAHHADDALETFLINLSRGTGLDGLKGIPSHTPSIFRPLLPFSRRQILEYAQQENLEWREDSSNQDPKYLRNKIRMEIVPILKELHPTFMDNFRATQSYLYGSSQLLEQYEDLLRDQFFHKENGHFRIPVAPLESLWPQQAYLHLLFARFGFREVAEVAALLPAGSGKVVYSRTHRLVRDRDCLLLQELEPVDARTYLVPLQEGRKPVPGNLLIEKVSSMKERSPSILYVDKETLNPILNLRKWRKGDYFYPLGMGGKKKVSKYFKDEKMDLIAKEDQWLLCSGDDIVWIAGRRADERFKVTDTTRTILKMTWQT